VQQSIIEPVLTGESYENLLGTLKSKETRATYDYRFKQFLAYAKVGTPDQLIAIDTKATEKLIQKYIESLKAKGLNRGTIEVSCAPLSKFYAMNDIVLNWKKLHSYLPEAIRTIEDTAYRRSQIIAMLNFASRQRVKVVIKLLASSGMRIGGIPSLKKKHLRPIEKYGLYEITVYAREKEQYITYCSPEARAEIDSYFAYRESCGEIITDNSPLIRNDFDRFDINKAKNAKFVNTDSIKFMLENLIQNAGLKAGHETNDDGKVSQRTTTMRGHGFRKFFDTALIKAGVKSNANERLMGWKSQRGLQHNYNRSEQGDLLEEYVKAIPLLTFSEELSLKTQNLELQEKNKEIEDLKAQMAEMREFQKLEARLMSNPNDVEAQKRLDEIIADGISDPNGP
jgi:integrase